MIFCGRNQGVMMFSRDAFRISFRFKISIRALPAATVTFVSAPWPSYSLPFSSCHSMKTKPIASLSAVRACARKDFSLPLRFVALRMAE